VGIELWHIERSSSMLHEACLAGLVLLGPRLHGRPTSFCGDTLDLFQSHPGGRMASGMTGAGQAATAELRVKEKGRRRHSFGSGVDTIGLVQMGDVLSRNTKTGQTVGREPHTYSHDCKVLIGVAGTRSEERHDVSNDIRGRSGGEGAARFHQRAHDVGSMRVAGPSRHQREGDAERRATHVDIFFFSLRCPFWLCPAPSHLSRACKHGQTRGAGTTGMRCRGNPA